MRPSRHSPLNQNLPLWSFAAIDEADRLFPGKRIFERGSGGSTLRYSKMGATIIAIEDDKRWLTLVQSALEKAGVDKSVVLKFVPFDFDCPVDFSSSDYLMQLSNALWDVVIIDGQDKTFRERIACFR